MPSRSWGLWGGGKVEGPSSLCPGFILPVTLWSWDPELFHTGKLHVEVRLWSFSWFLHSVLHSEMSALLLIDEWLSATLSWSLQTRQEMMSPARNDVLILMMIKRLAKDWRCVCVCGRGLWWKSSSPSSYFSHTNGKPSPSLYGFPKEIFNFNSIC